MSEQRRPPIRSHNLVFSLYQIRLIGILVLLLFSGRLVASSITAAYSPQFVRLSAYGFVTGSLPLLPIGLGLYLIGASHRRRAIELRLLPYLCDCLPVLAFVLGLIFPLILLVTLLDAGNAIVIEKLTPYQQELLSATRIAPSLVSCLITGVGLALLSSQMRRLFRKYGVSSRQFFSKRMT